MENKIHWPPGMCKFQAGPWSRNSEGDRAPALPAGAPRDPHLTKRTEGPLAPSHPQALAEPGPTLPSQVPSFLQVEAWKTHIWQDEKRRPRRRKIPFKVLVQ